MGYYERRLPHWHPDHAAIFVTWRLHGSLPRSARPPIELPAGRAFVAMDRELAKAETGPSWLKDERVAQCVVETLHFGEQPLRLYRLQAWMLMANHVHILIEPNAALPRITKSIKTFSAKRANEILGRTGEPFWQDESYDRWVRDQKEFGKIAQYIEFNPVAAGLVQRQEDWAWSSAHTGARQVKKADQEVRPTGAAVMRRRQYE
jgi:REP element-mobilizing transposase RayT